MSKIQHIEELREFALEVIEKLRSDKISTKEAVAASKACETVINTIKTEMDYQRLLGQKAAIPFMQSRNGNLLEAPIEQKTKRLSSD